MSDPAEVPNFLHAAAIQVGTSINGMTPAMAWGMGLVCILAIVVLILAALAKYRGRAWIPSRRIAENGGAGGLRGRHA